MSRREPTAPDGVDRALLDILTFNVDQARRYSADADETDVGHLRFYWDWRNPTEVEIARTAFDKAKAEGVAFFRVDASGMEGEEIKDFDAALAAAQEEPAEPAAGGRRGRRGGRPSVVGVAPVRGGSERRFDP